MKPYGHQRYDTLTCRYGCCNGKYGKQKNARPAGDRSRRKTARQTDKHKIFTQLLDS